MAEAFVYCWTDKQTNKLYIGSHKGDIDDGYICSSKTMLDEYDTRPQDFSRQIIAEGNVEDIRRLEYIILKTINAAMDESFYNKHNGFGSYLTEEIKNKISKSSKERWENEEYRNKVSQSQKRRWENISTEDKKRIIKKFTQNLKGVPKTEEHKNNMRGKRPNVNQTLSNNNNAVSIETPYGSFGSIKEASVALNIKYDNLWYKLRTNKPGWRRKI